MEARRNKRGLKGGAMGEQLSYLHSLLAQRESGQSKRIPSCVTRPFRHDNVPGQIHAAPATENKRGNIPIIVPDWLAWSVAL